MSRLGKRQLHELYYYLKLTRRLEEVIARLHGEGKITSPVCFVNGLEAVSVGAAYRLSSEDRIASSLPSLGSMLARGVSPWKLFVHFMGRATGPTRGRDGSSLLGDLRRGLLSPTGHVATHLGVMAGVALAAKTMGKPLVGVALMGARSLATGDFHEGLNFAAVHRLPLVVVVEHDPTSTATAAVLEGEFLYERMSGYGVASLPVDGADILQVIQVIETAVDRARDKKGPTLVEARTKRGASYGRCEDSVPSPLEVGEVEREVDAKRLEDPLSRDETPRPPNQRFTDPVREFESFLIERELLEPVERGLILDRIEKIIEAHLQKAETEPFPDPATVWGSGYEQDTEDEAGKRSV